MDQMQRLCEMKPTFDPNVLLWRVVDEVNKRLEVVLSDQERSSLEDQQILMHGALRSAIEKNTQIGRESGHGSTFQGVRVSLGSDDTFIYFIDYLISLGCDECKLLVADPEAFVPPRNWAHFELAKGKKEFVPRTNEGFLGDLVRPR